MKKYFTAVGIVEVKTLTEIGHEYTNTKFSHVVLADDDDDAHEKVESYYHNKGDDVYETFQLVEIEIFDFIS